MANQCSIIMAYSFYSAVGNISDFEDNDPVSDTIPDQSLSVRDIIHRYTRGQIDIPPVDQGEDQDIEDSDMDFDSFDDAFESAYVDSGLFDNLPTDAASETPVESPTGTSVESPGDAPVETLE